MSTEKNGVMRDYVMLMFKEDLDAFGDRSLKAISAVAASSTKDK